MIFFSNKARPYHWGPYPLERILRDPSVLYQEIGIPKSPQPTAREPVQDGLVAALFGVVAIVYRIRKVAIEDRSAGAPNEVSGDLVVTSLIDIAARMTPVLMAFQEQYPDVVVR